MQITIQDIAAAAQLIDIATQRGAFKANEATAVGSIFDKLSAFVQVANEQAEAAKAEADAVEKEQADSAAALAAGEDAAG